jgi:hypothetical protein
MGLGPVVKLRVSPIGIIKIMLLRIPVIGYQGMDGSVSYFVPIDVFIIAFGNILFISPTK